MWGSEVDRQQERPVLAGLDEADSFVDQQIRQRSGEVANHALDLEPRVDRLVAAVAETEKVVEPLKRGMEMIARAQVPFSEQCRGVARTFEQLGPGDRRGGQAKIGLLGRVDPVADSKLC